MVNVLHERLFNHVGFKVSITKRETMFIGDVGDKVTLMFNEQRFKKRRRFLGISCDHGGV